MTRNALVAGVTGIVGENLSAHLASRGDWKVFGLARRPGEQAGIRPIAADLLNGSSVRNALKGIDVSHAFFSTWLRQPTERENCEVNGAMLRNLLDALEDSPSLKHVALVTGTKSYLGSFETYGQRPVETPFREEQPRVPGLNFYYVQEDILFERARQKGFTWSVHRPHTIVGHALGNAMNIGVTLAVYASICRETGSPFVFPGSPEQYAGITDVTDARLLAKHLEWAALTPAAKNEAFNVVNGDVFRWSWLWPKLAAFFGLEAAPYPGHPTPLQDRMDDADSIWQSMVKKYELKPYKATEIASWWHTDADLGRTFECLNDMSKSRGLGFLEYQETLLSFQDLFTTLQHERIIP
jgi:nucleoside-diphosphate-sugar epimerase